MEKTTRITSVFIVTLLLFLSAIPPMASAESGNYLPFENKETGRNSNVYLSLQGTPPIQYKQDFVNEISVYAKEANKKWNIPASAIIGMAIIESGYGTTRIAINANNLFGIKVWGYNPSNAWQLKGQPNEDYEAIPVLADYGEDRKVYDETQRRDNWYRMFDSYEEVVNYLAGSLLLNQRYGFALISYENRLKSGWGYEQAANQYVYEIADAGFNHLGGMYYRNILEKVMTEWDLYQYDQNVFKDIGGSWAKKEIEYLTGKGWIDGYSDGTYRPNDDLTRAQAAKIMSSFLMLTLTNEEIYFSDVSNDFWGLTPVMLVAQYKVMNGIGDGRFAPNEKLTRAQMAQIFYNAGFYNQPINNNASSFKDVNKDHWAYVAIETMKKEGIMVGYSEGRFGANDPITRAQMAAVIYRLDAKGN